MKNFKKIALVVLVLYAAGLSFVNYLMYIEDEKGWANLRELNSSLATVKDQFKKYNINMGYFGEAKGDDSIRFSKLELSHNKASLELEQVLITGVGSTQLQLEARYNYFVAKENILNGNFEAIIDLSRNNDKLAMADIKFKLRSSGVERARGTLVLDYSQTKDSDVDNLFSKAIVKEFRLKLYDNSLLSAQAKATKDFLSYAKPEMKINEKELMSHVTNTYLNNAYIALNELGYTLSNNDGEQIKKSLEDESLNLFVSYKSKDSLTLKQLYEKIRSNKSPVIIGVL
ncbi:hypothetical protein D0436_18135 [Shewanella decolorationis]|uniref:hypothetical protein n=1 Tax=Shewanella decolorationis TaxID=256839 RepID=UPI0011BB64CD|nr:hypothetical protein [Shewanella decolorationis]QDZ92220.3 hypothetical protein D0436_18135 [Shewanella decolorationis]